MRRLSLLCLFLLATAQALHATTEQWQSLVTSNALTLNILEPSTNYGTAPVPVIIYLKNLAAPRTGTESDDAILQDFHTANYLVVTLDYAKNPQARVPFLNRDLGKLRDDLRAKKLLAQYKTDNAHIYIVPEGDRLLRDVVFYPDPKRTLALDIIYPSKPAKPASALIEFSCDNVDRWGNASLSICSDTILDAEATEGFAVAMADHPVPPPYKGIDPMPDCALKIKAAVRTLRATGDSLGMNGRIGVFGFSRGSGMALMLATTKGMPEFEGAGEQTNVDSSVQAAVVMSGRFTYLNLLTNDHMIPRYAIAWGTQETHPDVWRKAGALGYLTNATIPMFLSINCSESPDALYQMDILRKRLDDLGSKETFMLDPVPRGHKVPLVPEILGALNDYLEQQLVTAPAAAGKLAPKPLYRDPVYDGAADPTIIWNRAEKKWFMFYTNRRANLTNGVTGVEWVHGTKIGIAESGDGGATWSYRGTADVAYGGEGMTYWAPEVIDQGGVYHMYLTFVPGIFRDWNHPRDIIHLTSSNLLQWKYESTLKLASDRVIDPCAWQMPDGSWRLWYNNERDKKSIYYADSTNLFDWQDRGKAPGTSERGGEGPKVFQWKNYYWLVVDIWDGLRIYRSTNTTTWERQPEDILKIPGQGVDDAAKGHHCDVMVNNDRAYLFYFTHPGEALPSTADPVERRRSSIQVVELQFKDGSLTCDRNQPTYIDMQLPTP